MFGGEQNVTVLPLDTWEWNGSAWVMAETTGPPGRSRMSMVYDSDRGVCVLFGGSNTAGMLGDTWEYTGAPTPVLPTTWGRLKSLYGISEQ